MKIVIVAAIVLLIVGAIGSCGGGSSSSSYSSNNSNGRYGYGDEYDKKVDKIADAYGEDPDHVNDVINRLSNEID